jgi:eukaryotic-like serine/threonine-protein kinase
LSSYRVDHEIGRGGMAVVYAGWHEQLERPVALKVLADHLADDDEFRKRFLREARIASRLHHPNLVQTYDIAELDDRPAIVMELLPGATLAGGSLSREDAAEVAGGLAHAHSRGVVHRDLKPANLLRAPSGQVKIADFGIARAVEETMVTQIGTVLGTMKYLAPEQAEGRVVGPEADVYSLGVVFDELLDRATTADRELIARMRAHDPGLRPSAAEVATALGATQVLPHDDSRYDTAAQRGRRNAMPRRRSNAVPRRRTGAFPLRSALLAAGAAAAIAAALAIALSGGGTTAPRRVDPVPHATTPAQQARNLSAWLQRYSR